MKKILLPLIMLACFLLLAGCEKQNIKIGFAGGLTGTNSELGVSGMYGAQLAVDDLNQSGGIKGQELELIVKDDKGDKNAALNADQELREEGCVAIVGHMTSDMAELSVPYVNKNRVLMISPTIALPSLSGSDDYFFRLIPTTNDQAGRIVQELIKQGVRKVQLVYSEQNKVFAECINEYLINSLEEESIQAELIGSMKAAGNSDNDNVIKSIKESDSDALVVIASADIVSEIAQFLYKEDFQRKVFLPAWAMTNDLIKRGGPSVEGFYGVNFVDFDSKSEDYMEFRKKYIKKYGDEPTFASILSYESVLVLTSAMKEAKSYRADDLKATMIQMQEFKGLQGSLLINRFGDIERDIYLYQINGGKFEKADR